MELLWAATRGDEEMMMSCLGWGKMLGCLEIFQVKHLKMLEHVGSAFCLVERIVKGCLDVQLWFT